MITLPITEIKDIVDILSIAESAVTQFINNRNWQTSGIIKLINDILIQQALIEIDIDDHKSVRNILSGKIVVCLYQNIDLKHKSGQLLSTVFPQQSIDALANTSNAVIEAQEKIQSLSLQLQLAQDNNMQLLAKINTLETVHAQEIINLQNKLKELNEQNINDQNTQIKLISDVYDQQIKNLNDIILSLQSKPEPISSAAIKQIDNMPSLFDIATFQGKLNIAFVILILLITVTVVQNLILKNRIMKHQGINKANKRVNI